MKSITEKLNILLSSRLEKDAIVQPVFFRINDPLQKELFAELLNTPGIIVSDFLITQIEELIKIKTPYLKFTDQELRKKALSYIEPLSIEEYGVWVYYPWSNRLVHIVDEEEFIEIRTSRNQYKITKEERDELSSKSIGVVGLSVGQSVALTIAMERICGELRLADFDVLELTNLNRIRTGVHNLGIQKVIAVAREIFEIDPFLRVKCFLDGLQEENMDSFFLDGGKLNLLIEESDGLDIKVLSRFKARELKIPVLMETSDRCMVDVERFDLEPERSILHGLVDHLDIATLKKLKTNEDKIPYLLDILGLDNCSLRIKASMLEIDQTINTWPQLASSVTMGGGITADVSRRILLGQYNDSGRYHIDIEEIICDKKPKNFPISAAPNFDYTDIVGLSSKFTVIADDNQAKLSKAEFTKIVEAAILAPSGGNSQPWKWVLKNNSLLLFYDFDAEPTFLGYGNTATILALGSSMENAVLQAKSMHLDSKVIVYPDKTITQLVAQVKFYPEKETNSKLDKLVEAIGYRNTNRNIVERPIIEEEKLQELIKVAKEMSGADLRIFTSELELNDIADIIGEIEIIRLLEKAGQSDFAEEIGWTKLENEKRRDGVDIRTVDLTNSELAGMKIAVNAEVISLVKKWNGGGAFKKLTKKSIDSSGAVCILSMSDQTLTDYFNGGRILQRIWLTANLLGLAFQPITASIFLYTRLMAGKGENISDEGQKKLWDLRPKFENIFKIKKGDADIMIFRLTIADTPEVKSLRRPLETAFKIIDDE
jgi:tRNA A37 threonylcarbamoyladenosine dehydratase